MIIEIKNKEVESFLNSLKKEELVEFVESAIKEKILIYDTKKAVMEVKSNNLLSEEEFFSRVKSDS
jgi:hypothetical protein